MSRLPDHVIDDVRSRVDIVDVVSDYVTLQRSGRSYKGLCPFHSEKTPSFHVDQEQQLFYCFGCQAGGNAFNFLMRVENAPFGEVVRRLAEQVGIPFEEVEPSPAQARRRHEREALYRANEIAADFFVRALFSAEGEAARGYLKGRGLAAGVVRTFGIGFAPGGWHRLQERLKAQGVAEEVAVRAGILGRGRRGVYDWLRERITFPIADVRGRVVGFGGRILSGDGAKYLNTPESPLFSKRSQLYGLNVAKEVLGKEDRVVVVEGYMDVVGLNQSGFMPVVASLGTAFTPEQARLLRRFSSEVVLAYDSDAAGQAAVQRGLDVLAKEGLEVKVARLPEGHDPDSFVREHGLDDFLGLVNTSAPLIEYKLDEALKESDVESVEGRIQAVQRVLPVIASIEGAVGREGYITRAAARLGVTPAALADELRRYESRGGRESSTRHNLTRRRYTNKGLPSGAQNRAGAGTERPIGQGRPDVQRSVERDLLVWLLRDPEKATLVSESLGEEPFEQRPYNRLFQWMVAQGDSRLTGETLVGRIDDPELAPLAGSLLVQGERPPGPFTVYLDRVKEEMLRRQVKSLEAKLSLLMQETRITPTEVGRLVGMYKELRDRLHSAVGRNKAS